MDTSVRPTGLWARMGRFLRAGGRGEPPTDTAIDSGDARTKSAVAGEPGRRSCPDWCDYRDDHRRQPIDHHFAPHSMVLGELAAEPAPPAWVSSVYSSIEDDDSMLMIWKHRPDPAWPMEIQQGIKVAPDGRTRIHPVFAVGADTLPELIRTEDWLALSSVSARVAKILTSAEEATGALLPGSR
ncbi:MAG: hypothetical protein ACRCYQ_11940 [Nocardioides sp.]